MPSSHESDLVDSTRSSPTLPNHYSPSRPAHMDVERIVLAKGSLATPDRERFVRSICAVFSEARIEEYPRLAHKRFDLAEPDAFKRHVAGKRTLVFGEHKSAVRFSDEKGNTCPNYWHFSPYGFCPYGCQYCYLAGTQSVWHSPTVKIFVNLDEIVGEIDRVVTKLARPTAFYLGKLQDGLALDPLTTYSTVLVPFFAQHPFARQVLLTKSDSVERLLDLDHRGRTILSWSLNPPEIAEAFETRVPTVAARIDAMRRCAAKGYPIRAVIMPLIPVPNWRDIYLQFTADLVSSLPLQRLTFGGICSYRHARLLMEKQIGRSNPISFSFQEDSSNDGRMRYSSKTRIDMYRSLISAARARKPDVEIALCLEEEAVWRAAGLDTACIGRCNCVL